ncbi:hypothetical protein NHX12_002291 [Muraenolepis orangiensis]|uniref:Zona pellucida sperm-binding protein 4 n=1 Tax=Muraenolepis orangiensis TaxID=630683 RepID=A0A9Q0DU58_9TELE|nr:hypothetical protein NHX12_002291 [Muraenolepis orangiensis]
MERHSSATLVVALVLLGFYAGTLVEAQIKGAPQQAPAWPAQKPPQDPRPLIWQARPPKPIPQATARPAWPPQQNPVWQAKPPQPIPQATARPARPPQQNPVWQAKPPQPIPQATARPAWPPQPIPQATARPAWPPQQNPVWQAKPPQPIPQVTTRPARPPQQNSVWEAKPSQHNLQWDAQKEGSVPQQQNTKVPQLPPAPAQTCEVAIGQRVPCGGLDITADACNAISCCFDSNGCYYGKAVTVQCTKDGHFIVVVAKDATLPTLDLGSITLMGAGAGCSFVDSNSVFAIFHFPVTSCGSNVMEEPGVIIYENRMSSVYSFDYGDHGVITRDSSYELLFQCRYTGTTVETLVVQVNPLDFPPPPVAAYGPIQVELRLGNGVCLIKGCDEVDAAYTSYYEDSDYPVSKVLRDPVFIELRLLHVTDPNLVLTMGRCWTTTTPNPHSLPQWDICVDGCPSQNDRYLSTLIPVGASSGLDFPRHYNRVMFQMFTFVEPNEMTPLREQVYIHCSTSVCTPGPAKRHAPGSAVKKDPKHVHTVGPLEMTLAETQTKPSL